MANKVTLLADKADDARYWSPEQALQSALDDLRAGKIKPTQLAIVFREHHPKCTDGSVCKGCCLRWYAAVPTTTDRIALFELAKQDALRYWFGERS